MTCSVALHFERRQCLATEYYSWILWKCRILPPPPSWNCELNSKVRDHSEFDSRPYQKRWTEFERFVRSYDIDVSNYDEETWNDYVAELGDAVIEYDAAHIDRDNRFDRTSPVLCRVGDCIYRCADRTAWKNLYLAIVEREIAAANPALDALYVDNYKEASYCRNKTTRFINSTTVFFNSEQLKGKQGESLTTLMSNGRHVYSKYAPRDLGCIIAVFARYCDYTSSEIAIYAMPRKASRAKPAAPRRAPTMTRSTYTPGAPAPAVAANANRNRSYQSQSVRSVANTTPSAASTQRAADPGRVYIPQQASKAISTYHAEANDDDYQTVDADLQSSEMSLNSQLAPQVVNRAKVTRMKWCEQIVDCSDNDRSPNDVGLWFLKKMVEQARYHMSALCKQNAYPWISQGRRTLRNAASLDYGYYFDLENDMTMYDVVLFIEEFLGRANIPRYEVVIYAERDRTALGDGAPSARYRVPAAVPREAAPAMANDVEEIEEIDDEQMSRIADIFERKFASSGYIKGEFLHRLKFAQSYRDRYGCDCPCSDERLDRAIASIATYDNGKMLYDIEKIVPDDTRQRMASNIEKFFDDGAPCIFYSVILNKYKLGAIDDIDKLKCYLEKVYQSNGYVFEDKFFAKERGNFDVCSDVYDAVEENVLESLQAVAEVMPYIDRDVLQNVIRNNQNYLCGPIQNGNFNFIDVENVDDYPRDDESIARIGLLITDCFGDSSVLTYNALYDAMVSKGDDDLRDFLEYIDKRDLFVEFLARHYGDEFKFQKNCISKSNSDVNASLTGVLEEFFSGRNRVENVCVDLCNEIKRKSNREWGALKLRMTKFLYKNYTRIDETTYEKVAWTDDEIDAIDAELVEWLGTKTLIPLREMPLLGISAPHGAWNYYKLSSFIYRYSRQYAIVDEVVCDTLGNYGIVVRRHCPERYENKTHNELAAHYLAQLDESRWPRSAEDAESLLFNDGIIKQRYKKNRDRVYEEARSLRGER